MKGINSYQTIEESSEIRLNGNESYFDLDLDIMLKIKATICKLGINRYPENDSTELKELYSAYAGVKKENLVVGNGSDEMLGLIIGLNISKGKKLLTLAPDFEMYDYYVSMYSGETIKYNTAKDGSFRAQDFIDFGKEENVDIIMFSNPNNPTGYALSCKEIEMILNNFKNIPVVIDEAYFEFYGETMIPYIDKYKNLIVTRTLSKAWGLAAARVGFLITNESEVEKFKEVKVPYNVNSLSQALAGVVLQDIDRAKRNIASIIEEREILFKNLQDIQNEAALAVEFYNSKGNYIFGRSPYKEALVNGLKAKGILIRGFADETFRITIGSPFENKKLMESLKEIFMCGGKGL